MSCRSLIIVEENGTVSHGSPPFINYSVKSLEEGESVRVFSYDIDFKCFDLLDSFELLSPVSLTAVLSRPPRFYEDIRNIDSIPRSSS